MLSRASTASAIRCAASLQLMVLGMKLTPDVPQALMAPRGARILLDEKPAPPLAILQPQKPNRRLSAAPLKRETRAKNSKEWLITFTDVVVRAEKIGETE